MTLPRPVKTPGRERAWGWCVHVVGLVLFAGLAGLYAAKAGPRPGYERAAAALSSDEPERDRLERIAYELPRLEWRVAYEPHASLLRARLLLAAKHFRPALDELSIADSAPETQVRALVMAGEALYAMHRFYEAGAAWTKALDLDPDNLDAYRWLGVAYFELGAVEVAVRYLEEVARRELSDPRPHRVIGLIFSGVDEYGPAIEAYREALRRGPHHPQAQQVRLELARALNEYHQDREALEVLEACPDTPDVLALRGACLYGLGQIDQSLQTLNKALQADPEQFKAVAVRARIALERSDTQAVAEFAERAARLRPKSPESLNLQMAALLRLGRREEAKSKEEILKQVHAMYDNYHRLVSESSSKPGDADLRYRAGLVALDLELRDAAAWWFRAAVNLDPENSKAAELLRSLGVEDGTIADWLKSEE